MKEKSLWIRNAALLAATFGVAPIAHAAASTRATKAPPAAPPIRIVCAAPSSRLEVLAARELRRLLYLRSGQLPELRENATQLPAKGAIILVGQNNRALLRALSEKAVLQSDEYSLRALQRGGRVIEVVSGSDGAATLHAAYRLMERLGVGFDLSGEAIPDVRRSLAQIARALPSLNERGKPRFAIRGILPFHDFPEGPDWWNEDDYKSVVAQLPKLGMNFIGLHTYSEPRAEPTVWLGALQDVSPAGDALFTYPAAFYTTLTTKSYGYVPRKTSDFLMGAASLFERDDFGADVMKNIPSVEAQTRDDSQKIFERTQQMLRGAFSYARVLAIKTAAGTEVPLAVPATVRARLKAPPNDAKAELETIYEGTFRRAAKAYPLDYYWLWTNETWMTPEIADAQKQDALVNYQAAIDAAKKVDPPFQLAASGWILGPPNDRLLFDRALPKTMPMSALNGTVGMQAVDPTFARIQGRSKWAIPWLEDDPAMTAPQLWAGRMRSDAARAAAFGCDGLIGIHWRTRAISPNIAALSRAAWTRGDGNEPALPANADGPSGEVVDYVGANVENTEDDALYRSCRYNLDNYTLRLPDGTYDVTLKFCEPAYDKPNARVFSVRLQNKIVLKNLDVFARAGKFHALDFSFPEVRVTHGKLEIGFDRLVELPMISAIVARGTDGEARGVTRKINCGGAAYRDYAADLSPVASLVDTGFDTFYRDWATQQFGATGARIGAVFARIDGKLPRPANWTDGPGEVVPDARDWNIVRREYAFVDELEAMRPSVSGIGERTRFDYWLDTFGVLRAMGRLACARGAFDGAMKRVRAADETSRADLARHDALPDYLEAVAALRELYTHLFATIGSFGELGTLANIEQRTTVRIAAGGEELTRVLAAPLPEAARLSQSYDGPTRVIVTNARTQLEPGETLSLRVRVLSREMPRTAALYWRRMGKGKYAPIALRHIARGVYDVSLPPRALSADGIEWYVRVATPQYVTVFPATAPRIAHAVTVAPLR